MARAEPGPLARSGLGLREFLLRYRWSIIIHACACVLILLLLLLKRWGGLPLPGGKSDFEIYYHASVTFFEIDPVKAYDPVFLDTVFTVQPYRYFPALLAFFYPFTLVEPVTGHLLFGLLSVACNVATAWLAWRIMIRMFVSGDDVTMKRRIVLYTCLVLVVPVHLSNIGMGQVSSLVALCTVGSLHCLLDGKEWQGCVLLGLSMFFKPVTFFLIALYLFACSTTVKQLVRRAVFIVLPLLPDALLFLFQPGLLESFVTLNLQEMGLSRHAIDPSVSITNLLSAFLGVPDAIGFAALGGVSILAGLVLGRRLPSIEQKLVLAFVLGMLAFFVAQPDVWETQLVYLYPLLSIGLFPVLHGPRERWHLVLLWIYALACQVLAVPEARIVVVPVLATWLLGYWLLVVHHARVQGEHAFLLAPAV